MKIVKSGNQYQLFGNDLETFDKLPARTFNVAFDPMSGYSLVETDTLTVREPKIYGTHTKKQEKIFNSFDKMTRSLGVMMSGDKGIGKSLFIQMLAKNAIKRGLPVVIVTGNTPSLATFLLSIKQEVLILFDEFEKIFDKEDQLKLLSLFDGLNMSKHLYALTVNNLKDVNEYMLNRTGRIHYHLRFDYPTPEEIQLYLEDKVDKKYHSEIRNVIMFSLRMPLNFDLLRAIAFELNLGLTLKEALPDLNILKINDAEYNVTIKVKGVKPIIERRNSLDLFEEYLDIDFYPSEPYSLVAGLELSIATKHLKFVDNQFILNGEDIKREGSSCLVDISNRTILELTNHLQENYSNLNIDKVRQYPASLSTELIQEWIEMYDINSETSYSEIERALENYVKNNIEYILITPAEAGNKKYNVVL